MNINIENIPSSFIGILQLEADKHGTTMDIEATEILKFALLRKKTGNPAKKFQIMQELLMEKRGGVMFSDSTDIIRESRDNDH